MTARFWNGLLLALIVCTQGVGYGQAGRTADHNLNGWFMYFGDHPVKGKLGVHLVGQWRRHNLITRGQQLLLRPAINYEINPNLSLSAGYAFIATHRYGSLPAAFPFAEHRIYQQASAKQRFGKVNVEHRFRLEQRWLERKSTDAPTQWRYQDRFRYFVKGTVPITGKWYFGAYNEIFLNLRRAPGLPLFDQNRAYAAIGAKLNRTSRIEAGYLQQTLSRFGGRAFEYNHTLQIAIFSNTPLLR